MDAGSSGTFGMRSRNPVSRCEHSPIDEDDEVLQSPRLKRGTCPDPEINIGGQRGIFIGCIASQHRGIATRAPARRRCRATRLVSRRGAASPVLHGSGRPERGRQGDGVLRVSTRAVVPCDGIEREGAPVRGSALKTGILCGTSIKNRFWDGVLERLEFWPEDRRSSIRA